MKSKRYVLAQELDSVAGVSDLRESIQDLSDGYLSDIANNLPEIVQGYNIAVDRKLTLGQKALAKKALAEGTSQPWSYSFQEGPNGLFVPVQGGVTRPSELLDVAVVSGAVGSYLASDDREIRKLSRLDGLDTLGVRRLIGALAYEARSGDWVNENGATVSERGLGQTCLTWVGADLNGDFTVIQRLANTGPTLGPSGELLQFAPVIEENMVAALYVGDTDIPKSLLQHLRAVLSEEEREDLRQAILSKLVDKEQTPYQNFANYGTGNIFSDNVFAGDLDTTQLRPGKVLAAMMHSNTQSRIEVIHHEGWVTIGSYWYKTDGKILMPGREITLLDREIPDFIVSMANSGQSRTSVGQFAHVIDLMLAPGIDRAQ